MSAGSPQLVAAFGSTRTISLYHIHTKETLTITYKVDGKYDREALKKINWIMRDWRQNEAIEMDPKTIDLLWEMHTELGSREPIHIICGYRSEKTNNMLRRTVGGQAKQSKHMTGQAIDATFPDIPLKQLRWAATIREVGGIGYYPTSGVPFVHVDTGAVRAWPRLPRAELALLFPNGKTKHRPADGGSISVDDVRKARANSDVSSQVAAYFELRNNPKPSPDAERVVVAQAGVGLPADAEKTAGPAETPIKAPAPQPARPVKTEVRLASLEPDTAAAAPVMPPLPKLVHASRPVMPPTEAERGQLDRLVTLASLTPADMPAPQVPQADRSKLDALVSTASLDAMPSFMRARPAPPVAVAAPSAPASTAAAPVLPPAPTKPTQVAALEPAKLPTPQTSLTDAAPAAWSPAPEFDEDHPEELSYRPFPVAPLLTESASADDVALVKLKHPDLARTLDLLTDGQIVLPMRLRPGAQPAGVKDAQQFKGGAVDLSAVEDQAPTGDKTSGLTSRAVRTSAR